MVGIDELIAHGRHVRENTQPAERIDTLVGADGICRHRWATHTVESVAAGNEIALYLLPPALQRERHAWAPLRQSFHRDVRRAVANITAAREHGFVQVLLDFGLTV